jgi:hypothetical protein
MKFFMAHHAVEGDIPVVRLSEASALEREAEFMRSALGQMSYDECILFRLTRSTCEHLCPNTPCSSCRARKTLAQLAEGV